MNPMKPGIRYGQEFTANRRTAPGCPCMAHGSCTTRAQARDATRNTLHAIAKRAQNRALHELRALRAPGIPGHTRWRGAPILESPVTDSRRAGVLHCCTAKGSRSMTTVAQLLKTKPNTTVYTIGADDSVYE